MAKYRLEATSIKARLMERGLKSGETATVYMFIAATYKTVKFKDSEFTNGQMADITLVISLMRKCTDMESCLGLIVMARNVYIRGKCLLMLFMAAENFQNQMGIFIQVNFRMGSLVDKELICGRMKN